MELDQKSENLLEELDFLRKEVALLKNEKAAFELQKQLLENLVETENSRNEEVLKTSLQHTLDLAAVLTKAEKGSLFLLESSGKVTEAILTRAEVTAKQKASLIGNVLDKGLAGWVGKNRQIGLISDTETDDRWLKLPDQPYVARSALAIPILRGENLLGILTLLHSQVNHFSLEVVKQMQITADHMALVLENARLYSKLDKYSKALDSELEKGRQIQRDFLPSEIFQPVNWHINACFHPAQKVAGDFYDAFPLGQYVGLVIADVCDKGVGAALFMALMRSLIRVFSGQIQVRGPSFFGIQEPKVSQQDYYHYQNQVLQAVQLTNNYVAQNHGLLGMFATMFFGVLDPLNGLLLYINGGHEPLLVINKSDPTSKPTIKTLLEPTGPAVGIIPNIHFEIKQVQLEPGDILLGYTDGVTEAKNSDGNLFTYRRLLSLLEQPFSSASSLLNLIEKNLFDYMAEAPQFDDITMLTVERMS